MNKTLKKKHTYKEELNFYSNKFIKAVKKLRHFNRVFSFFKHYIVELINRIDDHHVFLLAGGLAFSLFICIIPFILIIFSVLGNILDSKDMQYQVTNLVDTVIPYSQYSEYVKKIIFSRISEVIEYKTAAGIIGVFGLLFAASGLFSSMRTILHKIYNIEIKVNFFLEKLWDFALVVMVILIFFMMTISMPIMDVLRQNAFKWKVLSFFQLPIFEHFIFSALSFVLIFVLFFILYVTVPLRKQERKQSVVSALAAAFLWEAAKQLFGYYIYNFSNYGKIYGTYALMVVVAFWIYYSSIVFIIGAEIGRLYFEKNLMKTG